MSGERIEIVVRNVDTGDEVARVPTEIGVQARVDTGRGIWNVIVQNRESGEQGDENEERPRCPKCGVCLTSASMNDPSTLVLSPCGHEVPAGYFGESEYEYEYDEENEQ